MSGRSKQLKMTENVYELLIQEKRRRIALEEQFDALQLRWTQTMKYVELQMEMHADDPEWRLLNSVRDSLTGDGTYPASEPKGES